MNKHMVDISNAIAFITQLTNKEVSKILNYDNENVHVAINRAREKLQGKSSLYEIKMSISAIAYLEFLCRKIMDLDNIQSSVLDGISILQQNFLNTINENGFPILNY